MGLRRIHRARGDRPPVKLAVDAAIGIATWQENDTIAAVFARADASMYLEKKSAGRVPTPA